MVVMAEVRKPVVQCPSFDGVGNEEPRDGGEPKSNVEDRGGGAGYGIRSLGMGMEMGMMFVRS